MIQIHGGQVTAEYFDTLTENPVIPSWIEGELRAVYGQGVIILPAANIQQFDGNACGPLMIENLVQRALGIRNQTPRFGYLRRFLTTNRRNYELRTNQKTLAQRTQNSSTAHGKIARRSG